MTRLMRIFGRISECRSRELGRLDEAIDAMRRTLAAGWDGELDDHPSAEALIAALLLRSGRPREADAAWLEAKTRTVPPCTGSTGTRWDASGTGAGSAYMKGLHGKALP